MKSILSLVCVTFSTAVVAAAPGIPTADKPGSADSPLLKRYEGSVIVSYEHKGFDAFTMPLSRLETVPGAARDSHNNSPAEPKRKLTVEGPYTRIAYVTPPNRSPLEVIRNYEDELKGSGGKLLYECNGKDCAAHPELNVFGGGSYVGLAAYLYPQERVSDRVFSMGWCVFHENLADVHYAVAEIPATGAHVSLLTYGVPGASGDCKLLVDRTVAVIDIIESKGREQRMVTVRSAEMAQAISTGGKVALYGLYFDPAKADLKPESEPTVKEIARLLGDNPSLKLLVVGHTDNSGAFKPNMDLSQRRAAAVVTALTQRFGVKKDRLTPIGVSFAAPVASNKAEDGRSKNRRVELIEN